MREKKIYGFAALVMLFVGCNKNTAGQNDGKLPTSAEYLRQTDNCADVSIPNQQPFTSNFLMSREGSEVTFNSPGTGNEFVVTIDENNSFAIETADIEGNPVTCDGQFDEFDDLSFACHVSDGDCLIDYSINTDS